MGKLLDSTNYIIGIYSLRACVFECISFDDVKRLRALYNHISSVTPHCGLHVYTRDEWVNGYVASIPINVYEEMGNG